MRRMPKTGWILAVGVGIVIIALVISKRPSITTPIPTRGKPPGPGVTPVSLQPHTYINCNCVNNVLTGPNCSPHVKGKSCTGLMNAINADRNCVCDSGGTMTGEGCPYIGITCIEYEHTYNPNPAHVHTTCPKGSVLMGTTCVKEYDNHIHPTTASV